jgi:aerobic carbon-monoxide dehydrogenase medium subunit
MKSAPFNYVRARSLPEVFDLIEAEDSDVRILAGGQSLLATLALRLSEPAVLVDIGGLSELHFIEERGGAIHIGALARHCELEKNRLVAEKLPLIAQAMPHVAHAAIRNRGTIGGSLSLADPAAELPACMLALEATIVLASRTGERRVRAEDFFQGLYRTDIKFGELLVRVEIVPYDEAWRFHFAEFSRRRGDFAMVGLAAGCRQTGALIEELRWVFFGCGDRPVRARAAEAVGSRSPDGGQGERYTALRNALEKDLDPQSDPHASATMRMHLAAVLADRSLGVLAS